MSAASDKWIEMAYLHLVAEETVSSVLRTASFTFDFTMYEVNYSGQMANARGQLMSGSF